MINSWKQVQLSMEHSIAVSNFYSIVGMGFVHCLQPFCGIVLGPLPRSHHMWASNHVERFLLKLFHAMHGEYESWGPTEDIHILHTLLRNTEPTTQWKAYSFLLLRCARSHSCNRGKSSSDYPRCTNWHHFEYVLVETVLWNPKQDQIKLDGTVDGPIHSLNDAMDWSIHSSHPAVQFSSNVAYHMYISYI